MLPAVDGESMFIVNAQLVDRFPLNAWDMENIVGFLMPSSNQFAWEPIKTKEECLTGGGFERRDGVSE